MDAQQVRPTPNLGRRLNSLLIVAIVAGLAMLGRSTMGAADADPAHDPAIADALNSAIPSSAATSTPPAYSVLVGAGDIASCGSTGDTATANLIGGIPGTVITLGDNAYETGTTTDFTHCYDPTWGAFKDRTRPAPGNHDYLTTAARGYFSYFGPAAGDPTKGYYSYNRGQWHIVIINSSCPQVGGCQAGSAQEQWLRADLASSPKFCTLAYWHHPRFSSGEHGSLAYMQPIWQALYDANVDVVLNGHDHDYERFAPQDPAGNADPTRGIREFVVGTGGKNHRQFGTLAPNSEVRDATSWGVIKLRLYARSYDWQFIPVPGSTFTDSGSGACH